MTSESQRQVGPPRHGSAIHDPRIRAIFYQVVFLVAVLWGCYQLGLNVSSNLETQRIATGFGFLGQPAGFAINQTLIPYSETNTYGRVFLVGLLNTLLVAVIGVVFATLIGFVVGIARLSPNWLVARLATGYVELIRNLPLLFQIMFWYLAVLGTLPQPRQSLELGVAPLLRRLAESLGALDATGIPAALNALAERLAPASLYLNNRGLILPEPAVTPGGLVTAAIVAAAVAALLVLRRWARRRQEATGETFPLGRAALLLLVGVPLAAAVLLGSPVSLQPPELRGFNFIGGVRLIPEFVALVIALSTYTAAFIAEVVRAGILAVPRGQTEAAMALGLDRRRTLRLIVVPQALRIIVPPLTNQYLNLTKNSTLAAAIGYPDLFSVFAGSALNITGQAIEIIAIIMAVYLTISLATSAVMSWYNARIQLAER